MADSSLGEKYALFDLDPIPLSNKTYNASGLEQNSGWTTATVLLFDPRMEIGVVDVILSDHIFNVSRIDAKGDSTINDVGLNWSALVVSTSFNVFPSVSVGISLASLNFTAHPDSNVGSSLLAFDIALQELTATSPVTPQVLSNMSSTLNRAATIIGANTYFD